MRTLPAGFAEVAFVIRVFDTHTLGAFGIICAAILAEPAVFAELAVGAGAVPAALTDMVVEIAVLDAVLTAGAALGLSVVPAAFIAEPALFADRLVLCENTLIAALADNAAFYAVMSVAFADIVPAVLTDRAVLQLFFGTLDAVMALVADKIEIVAVIVAEYQTALLTGLF